MSDIIKGFKGFDKNLQCKGHQYELGGEYQEKSVKACHKGFHFCENPLDVFSYYPPAGSRFAEVEGSGKFDRDGSDSKVACTKIRIGAELTLSGLISAGVKFILERVDWESAATNTGDMSAATNTGYRSAATNTGYRSAATNTGDMSAATNTGYRSAATNTGDMSAATVDGKQSIACGLGIENKTKGALTCWLVLAEWERDREMNWQIKHVKTAQVDGENIKADTWYQLKDGQFVECEE